MIHGIVFGKFLPPHRGHKHLIDTATAQSDELTVIVCDKRGDDIPASLRAAWLREIHPTVRVVVVEDIERDEDSKAWAEYTVKSLGSRPDVVFSSEDYGERYAEFLGARHVMVDRERRAVPISGTQVRCDPLGSWSFLEPSVRAYFARRVCFVGAESTGKTSLAEALARHFGTAWVPEFGRQYWEGKMFAGEATGWTSDEFEFIARRQNEDEDWGARRCDKLLVCDTDSFATGLWHERYVGHWSDKVEALSLGRHYDLYFLAGDEIPFVQDGTRDGEHIRHDMQLRFREELERRRKPYVLLSGSFEERVATAICECRKILESRSGF